MPPPAEHDVRSPQSDLAVTRMLKTDVTPTLRPMQIAGAMKRVASSLLAAVRPFHKAWYAS